MVMAGNAARKLAACALLALGAVLPAAAADKVKVTYPTLTTSFIFFFTAIDKGFYAEEGLDLDVVEAGGGVATPALVSGDAQFSTSGSSAISAIMKGAKLKVLMVGEDRPSWQIWSTKPEVKTLQDLKGQQIGILSRGDTGEVAVRYLLKKNDLPADYVSFTPMGSSLATRMAVVHAGSLPAALLQPAEVEQLKANGGLGNAHLLADTATEVRSTFNGLATSDALIRNHPDVVLRFVRATRKGMIYAKTLKAQAIDVFVRRMKGSATGAETGYDELRKVMAEDGTISPDAQATEIALRAEMLSMKDKVPPAAAVFDFSWVDKVNAELKASVWQPKP
jgi:ABC-type nitrate/sulfonate/bicarbonate transport system substrate-binding protein